MHHSFEKYGMELGLPGTVVTSAVQTRDGYLWVGTPAGIGRFDGVRFTNYYSADTPGLPSDLIHCFHEDRNGGLWIGTDKGLCQVVNGRFKRAGLDTMSVRTLAEDRLGNLWAGTWGAGIHVFRGGHWDEFVAEDLPRDLRVRALFVDSRGRIWIAQDRGRGVFRIEGGRATKEFDGAEGVGEVQTICEAPEGTLWFGTKRTGLFRLRNNQLVRHPVADGSGSLTVYEIRRANSGGLWLVTGGLNYSASAERPRFDSIDEIPNENVQSVCEDREGGLWLCAGSEGLIRMRELPYRLLSTRQGLPTDNVKNVTEDPSGALWLTTQGAGIVHVDAAGKVIRQRRTEGLPESDPSAVYAARDGTVWAGTGSHLWVRRGKQWQQDSDLRFVRGLFEDRDGIMWVGTEYDGLFRFENGKFAEVRTSVGESVPFATSFAEAGDGSLVVGTWQSGIWRVSADGKVAQKWASPPPVDEVRAVHVDSEGLVWAGLSNRGLVVWDSDHWLIAPGLMKVLGSSVSAILEEESGRIWLGTLAGVLWAQRDELLDWMRAPVSVPPVHAVPVGDDIGIIPVWSGAQPVGWRTAGGRLLFATRRGVLAIDSQRAVPNAVPPPVHIERVFVDRHAVETDEPVQLPPGTRSLAIDYTAPSFVQADRMLFRYKLEGHDSDWIDAASLRSAYYGSLRPGSYVFRVSAGNSDGVWSETVASVAIVQLPHFYQTAWFSWMLAALAGAAIWGAYWWSNRHLRLKLERLEQERAMENERRRIAQDLHDDLGASLTEIGLFADSTRRTAPPEEKAGLDHLAQRVRALAGSLDAIVWAVNPANDSLDQLVMYVGELFQELFRSSGIRARLDISPAIPRLPLSAEERSDLFLTTKEAMNNMLKHSGASEASLRIRMITGELRIT
ncbi:MAG: hypothetical protein KAX37_11140, partial [Opitutaceae bacterium]|nr:hypothetical protein [Opitutaceae bacterium]